MRPHRAARLNSPAVGSTRTRCGPIWKEILPSDREELVRSESRLVAANIHSRRQSMAALGDPDPDRRWTEIMDELAALGTIDG